MMTPKQWLDSHNPPFREYVNTRNHYLSNAQKLIENKRFRKASEFLWGAIAQAIKSLASLRGIPLRGHGLIRNFIRDIASDLGDEELYTSFQYLETLHKNFYDKQIEDEDFPLYYKKTLIFLKKIDEIIKSRYSSA